MAQSGLIFNAETGLYAPDTEELRKSVAADWQQAFFEKDKPTLDTEPTTPAGQLIDAEVAEIEAKNAELLYLASMFNPKVAEGRWQDALGYMYFLERKLDEPTLVTCQLTGLKGTVIPYGALVQSTNGYTLICNQAVTIDATGTAETTFRLSENGGIDIPSHAVNAIVTTIPGWDTVDNASAGAIGRDKETRSEFEARRSLSVAKNAHGSTGSLFGTIANIAGVLDLKILENIGSNPVEKYGVVVPGHGITVCIYGGEDKDIAEAIYQKKDNGCDTGGNTTISYTATDYNNALYAYKILRPQTVNFWIKVVLSKEISLTTAQIATLKNAIYEDFYGLNEHSGTTRIGLASTVYASRFYCPALEVEGVNAIQSIEIALSTNKPKSYSNVVEIRGDQEPTLSKDNIIVAFV